MANVYRAPEGFDPPSLSSNYQEYDRLCQEYTDRLAAEARKDNSGDLVGEVINFPVADGYASYMVWSHRPLNLIHLAFGDAYSIPTAHARGLRLADVRDMVERERRIKELFASRK